jgi:hypothetical protein
MMAFIHKNKGEAMRKELGKIESVNFGLGGYQGVQFGVWFCIKSTGGSASDGEGVWTGEITESTQWTEKDRGTTLEKIMRYVMDLIEKAKVKNFNDLVGVPVEATIENNSLKAWRILTEVL